MIRNGVKMISIALAAGLAVRASGTRADDGTEGRSMVMDLAALTVLPVGGASLEKGDGRTLQVRPLAGAPRSGVRLEAPDDGWDLRPFTRLNVTVRNTGPAPLRVLGRFEDPVISGRYHSGEARLGPDEQKTFSIRPHHQIGEDVVKALADLRTNPRALATSEPVNVAAIDVLALYPETEAHFVVVALAGDVSRPKGL